LATHLRDYTSNLCGSNEAITVKAWLCLALYVNSIMQLNTMCLAKDIN